MPKSKNNCLYGLNNKIYDGCIKIGSTKRPEFRKYDYITGSPYPYYYDWIVYLKDYNCYLLDDLMKIELNEYRMKEGGSIEFYEIINHTPIIKILDKYHISYTVKLKDPFEFKPNNYLKNSDIQSKNHYNSMLEKFRLDKLKFDPIK